MHSNSFQMKESSIVTLSLLTLGGGENNLSKQVDGIDGMHMEHLKWTHAALYELNIQINLKTAGFLPHALWNNTDNE